MADTELRVRPRDVFGKKLGALRRRGVTPGNVYGHRVDSTAVESDTTDLAHLLRAMSKNQVINLTVEGESSPRTVVIRELARNPLNGQILHVDFFQVSMTEKMKAQVPVVLSGTSEAVSTLGGVLMQMIDTIAIEALPGDIPSEFEVDVSQITQLEQSIHVRDLHIDETRVSVSTDPDVVVARVAAPRLATAEEEAAEAAAAEGEAAEGAPAAESEEAAPAEKTDE
jgi:large subunit ribosomal protein L25